MRLYKNILLLSALYCVSNMVIADKNLHFINPEAVEKITSIEPLKQKLKTILATTFSQSFSLTKTIGNFSSSSVTISFGINDLKQSLEQTQRVDIATLVTQAEITSLIKKYPQQLRKTKIILNGSVFQCQLQLFKKINPPQKNLDATLGILLTKESSLLLTEIESYAKKHSINISFLVLKNHENIVRGYHYLMQKNPMVMMIADNQLYQPENLKAIFHEARLMKKTIISSTSQHSPNINQQCTFTNENTIKKIIELTGKALKGIDSTKQPLDSLITGYQVFVP